MRRQLLICIMLCFAASPAVAQKYDNSSPEVLKNIEAYKSKESINKLLSETYHVAISDTWPTNFPLPVYTSNLVSKSFSHSTKGKPTAGAMLITSDQPKTVFDFYNAACKRTNWNVRVPSAKALAELNKSGEMYILNAVQGKQTIYLTCRRTRENNGTLVSINWTKAP